MDHRASYAVVCLVIALIAGSSLALLYLSRAPEPQKPQVMTGSLFVSDAGRSHGGFECTATWNATLVVSGGREGSLTFMLNIGLGDALSQHNFMVTEFSSNATTVTMLMDGQPLTMRWVANDAVWNGTYDGYYVASWGSDSPANELIGHISPAMFPGLHPLWYVELRLH